MSSEVELRNQEAFLRKAFIQWIQVQAMLQFWEAEIDCPPRLQQWIENMAPHRNAVISDMYPQFQQMLISLVVEMYDLVGTEVQITEAQNPEEYEYEEEEEWEE